MSWRLSRYLINKWVRGVAPAEFVIMPSNVLNGISGYMMTTTLSPTPSLKSWKMNVFGSFKSQPMVCQIKSLISQPFLKSVRLLRLRLLTFLSFFWLYRAGKCSGSQCAPADWPECEMSPTGLCFSTASPDSGTVWGGCELFQTIPTLAE